jgi:hypothetical protein
VLLIHLSEYLFRDHNRVEVLRESTPAVGRRTGDQQREDAYDKLAGSVVQVRKTVLRERNVEMVRG